MRTSQLELIERRRRNIRVILATIIFITIPFYCAGIILWGTAPPRQPQIMPTATTPFFVTSTPVVVTATSPGEPSITPLPITIQFPTETFQQPPTVVLPTRFLSPTPPFVFPTATPFPTQPPPTAPPPITDTPLPFDPPSS